MGKLSFLADLIIIFHPLTQNPGTDKIGEIMHWFIKPVVKKKKVCFTKPNGVDIRRTCNHEF